MNLDIAKRDIVILSATRTAFGNVSGALKKITAIDLAVEPAKAAMERAGVAPDDIDHVIVGNVAQTSVDAIYMARHVGLKAGVPITVPALTVNRLCGSGFQAVVTAAEQILTGQATAVLCGGTESMSQAPHSIFGLRDGGARLGRSPQLVDMLWESLSDPYAGCSMGQTAENVGDETGVTRAEADEYAFQSQQRWQEAHAGGHFKEEIVPLTLKTRKGETVFDTDEGPRPSPMEVLQGLKPVFRKDGLVTAGNASGITDGAAMLVVADAKWAEKKGLQPLARLVGWGVAGVEPKLMGLGPVPASRKALEVAGLRLDDIALVEVNEAFAPQYLGVEKQLGLDRSITNVNGGAIALGHPLGATGARITGHLVHELRRRGDKYGLGTACIGGGQGIAVLVEAV